MESKTIKAKEIAQEMGLSLPVVYELLNQEEFPSIRVGRRIVVPRASFDEWLMKSATNKLEVSLGR